MAGEERFQAQGGSLRMAGNGNPQLGRPAGFNPPGDPTKGTPIPRLDAQARGGFTSPRTQGQAPQGATPVPLAGARREAPAAPEAATPVPQRPEGQTVPMAQSPAPPVASVGTPGGAQRPFLQRPAPKTEEVFRVVQMGTAPDGTPLSAEFDAVFPAGTRLSGPPTVTPL